MATIVEKTLKNGSKRFLTQITRRGHMKTESKTLHSRKEAERWAKKREKEIDEQISSGINPTKRSTQRRTLSDAINRYLVEDRRGMGKTKKQVLETIRDEYEIAKMACDQITSSDISNFANQLWQRPKVNSSATVNNYLQHLSKIFSVAAPLWGFALDEIAMKRAMKALGEMGIRGKAVERDRRPTIQELDRLMSHFTKSSKHDPRAIPMHVITAFAIFSTRRQAEICRITWADYEPDIEANETGVLVRDMKHPGDKNGNDTWCTLPDPCHQIIAAHQSKGNKTENIFPYHSDSISRRFTDACKLLDIKDLRFHDLRHEGTSRLFEMNWNVDRVADVTGHRSWESLKRYRHYKKHGDKFNGWHWLANIT